MVMMDDLEKIQGLILWARKERISISSLTVGSVSMCLSDMALSFDSKPSRSPVLTGQNVQDAYKAWGGPLLEQLENTLTDSESGYSEPGYEDE